MIAYSRDGLEWNRNKKGGLAENSSCPQVCHWPGRGPKVVVADGGSSGSVEWDFRGVN